MAEQSEDHTVPVVRFQSQPRNVSWFVDMDGNGGDIVETPAGGGKISLAARRSANLPKLNDLLTRSRRDAEMLDCTIDGGEPDLNFEYGDCDSYSTELAELYTYSEVEQFDLNAEAFSQFVIRSKLGGNKKWKEWTAKEKDVLIQRLMEELELAKAERRVEAVKVVLYLLQGNFNDCESESNVLQFGLENAYLLYEKGMFTQLCEVLSTEIEAARGEDLDLGDLPTAHEKVSMDGNLELRLALAAIYHFVESLRTDHWDAKDVAKEWAQSELERMEELRNNFRADLGSPLIGGQTLPVALFRMIITFCAGVGARFPMRKVLLLLWKSLLCWLGGWAELRELKIKRRLEANLTKGEDTILIASTMHSAAPPLGLCLPGMGGGGGSTDPDGVGGNRSRRPPLAKRQLACSATDDDSDLWDSGTPSTEQEDEKVFAEPLGTGSGPGLGGDTPRPGSPSNIPVAVAEKAEPPHLARSFAWAPKIRPQEVEAFLENERVKFFGFTLPGDGSSTAGFPQPIKESLLALQRHVYTSLGDYQIKKEENLNKFFFSQKEEIRMCPAEELYRQLLPELPQHMIALLKLLLSAFPSTVAKTDAITILSDCVPAGSEPFVLNNSISLDNDAAGAAASEAGLEQSQTMRLEIDVKRHKEVIVKATSAILLLLVKHFRLNHVYQFEYMSQHLVFANCIPLILKFFDQNIQNYIQSKNELPLLNYPKVAVEPPPEDFGIFDREEKNAKGYFRWRNLFSAINQLRLLNKLTKWKHARTMMLVVFKSAPIMKRALRVRHILLQLYALKILKMQSKHLGRQWRKTNMEIMSAIYSKVRHRLNDDWAYGNETQSKAFDFQAEESQLRSAIENFHLRRYGSSLASSALSSMSGSGPGPLTGSSEAPLTSSGGVRKSNGGCSALVEIGKENFHDPEFLPYDNNIVSVLGAEYKLTERFKVNYEKWLEQEVLKASIDWDELLANNRGSTAA